MRNLIRYLSVIICVFFSAVVTVPPAQANQCVVTALKRTEAALGNQRALKELYDEYFGEDLAKQPVASRWNKMDAGAKKLQVEHARKVVISLATKLSRYARADFTWKGNIGIFRLGKETGQIRVTMAGGCRMSNICIKDVGCLRSYISDVNKLAKK